MPLLFLKRVLSGYTLEKHGGLSFFSRDPEDPLFCLLPFWISQKTVRKLSTLQKSCPNLVYLKPQPDFLPLSKKILLHLQPLYFMKPEKNKSFVFCDRRFLKTISGLYLVPFVSIELIAHKKKPQAQDLEKNMFFPSRENTSFYFQGDTTHRLLTPSYLEGIQQRQSLEIKPRFRTSRFLKKILDK